MAYHTRTRDPLLETHMQTAIRRRGTELVGLLLLVLAGLATLALGSYSPSDPSFFNATSEVVQNRLGKGGATFAGTLILTIGWAAWTIPLVLFSIGLRLVFHIKESRLLWRVVFTPVFIVVTSVFLATHAAPNFWPHSWGLGGFSGDAALELLIDANPISLDLWLRILSAALGLITIWLGLFSTGFSWAEVKSIVRFSVIGIIMTYSLIANGIEYLFSFGQSASRRVREQREIRRERADGMPTIQLEGHLDDDARSPKQMGRKTLFPTLPVFGERVLSQPSPKAPPPPGYAEAFGVVDTGDQEPELEPGTAPELDRVQRRIAEAIERKGLNDRAHQMLRADQRREPPLVATPEQPDDLSADIRRAMEPVDISAQAEAAGAAVPEIPVAPDNLFEDAMQFIEPETVEFPAAPTAFQAPPAATPKPRVEPQNTAPAPQSKAAEKEAQPNLFASETTTEFEPPALSLLTSPTTIQRNTLSNEALEENARMLENVLDDYGVKGEIVSVRPGPVVTMYELEPAPGLKASRVIGLADDIARSMSALSARVSTVPGRSVIGIELPNDHRETVLLREILSARDYGDGTHALPLALGKDIGGSSEVADLAKMPHLLIAGTTGSGKSVAINTMILSLLYKLGPEDCRMIMIDPKMLELSVYDGIPHLLSPVVTDPKKAVVALKWVVGEMEDRYRKMSKMGVRNIAGYNARVADALAKGENFERTVQTGFEEATGEPIFETESFAPEKLPFIVVVVDEMADLMMVAGKEIEACIQRLAQMARASGIHLIMATQRPSVDVITGTIKANFPTRISFQVTSKVDSRTILGEMGAEQLLGMGDMLYMAGGGKITRIHAPFVKDEEVEMIVAHLKTFGPPEYVSGVVKESRDEKAAGIDEVLGLGGNTSKENALYDQAVAIVAQDRKCSTSYIQRKLGIGYNKAAKLVEEMEDNGVVSSANHVGKREILLPED